MTEMDGTERLVSSGLRDPVAAAPATTRPIEGWRKNSFDAIRLFAAFCVFYSHQLGMTGHADIVSVAGQISLSSLGLYIFFGLSGYLVYKSLERNSDLGRYARARALRIYPGFIANTLFVVGLGCLLTTEPLWSFLSDPQTLRYLKNNLPIVTTPTQFELPGVFQAATWNSVNGSIWTIKYELICYAALYPVFILRRVRPAARLLLEALLVALVLHHWYHISRFPLPTGTFFFGEYNVFNLSRFLMTFFAGALYASREPLTPSARATLFAIPAVTAVFSPNAELTKISIILLLTLLAIEIGKTRVLFSGYYHKIGDLSYGSFLYAYPLQSYFVTYYYDGENFAVVTAASVTAVVLVASLSWRLVEKPCLRLKDRDERAVA